MATAITISIMALVAFTTPASAQTRCEDLHLSGYGSSLLFTAALRACGAKAQECAAPPKPGEIKIIRAPYGKSQGCQASILTAAEIVHDFDIFESHAPEVIYKSSGRYPVYTQQVIQGGCRPDRKNWQCAD